MSGVYVHVPFCRRRCIYCDFYTVGERLAVWGDYVSAVLVEARERLHPSMSAGIDTIYIGGGTPSLLPEAEFRRLAEGLLELTGNVTEFTVEVNPDDVTPGLVSVWRESGVNRISMGVQSLVDAELRVIGRRHDASRAREAYEVLRRGFDNVSLDLMFGLPGQTLDSLRKSVEGIITMSPEHVSVYSLMYEERTALTRLRDEGRIAEQSEQASADMFRMLSEMLAGAGYEQYEISNYAKPGFQSRHNSAYWQGTPYIGLGPGAHSYDGDRLRTENPPDLRAYLNYWGKGVGELPAESETLGDDELREEMIMTRLRTREGLDLAEFSRRFGESETHRLLRDSHRWLAAGLLTLVLPDSSLSALPKQLPTEGRLALTRDGIMISDEIFASLF